VATACEIFVQCARRRTLWNVSWLRKLDANMGKMFKIYLCGDKIYGCSTCRTHLAKHDQIVSKVRGCSHHLFGVLVLDG